MAKQTNHPLKTLVLLAIVAAVGWGAYEFVYVRGILRSEPTQFDVQDTREKVRNAIFEELVSDPCLLSMDEISDRANEHHFRVRVTVTDECTEGARALCETIAEIGSRTTQHTFGVFAYDRGGNRVAKYVQ